MARARFTAEEVARLVQVASAAASARDGSVLASVVKALPTIVRASLVVACILEGDVRRILHAHPSRARQVERLATCARAMDLGKLGEAPRIEAHREGSVAAFGCPTARGLLVVALGRERGAPPFGERDRAILSVLRPLIVAAAQGEVEGAGIHALTPREAEIARHAARGLGDREIARALSIGFATVRTHLQRAFAKLGVSSRTELAWIALGPARSTSRRPSGRRGGRRRARGR